MVYLGTDAAVLYMTRAHGPHGAGTCSGAAGRENVVSCRGAFSGWCIPALGNELWAAGVGFLGVKHCCMKLEEVSQRPWVGRELFWEIKLDGSLMTAGSRGSQREENQVGGKCSDWHGKWFQAGLCERRGTVSDDPFCASVTSLQMLSLQDWPVGWGDFHSEGLKAMAGVLELMCAQMLWPGCRVLPGGLNTPS